MRLLYDIGLLVWSILQLPSLIRRGKGNLIGPRLGRGLNFPQFQGPVIWVHAVSLGETKASRPLVTQLKKEYPDHKIVFSTGTETGQLEAKKIAEVDFTFYLPLDFSWVMKKVVRQLQPQMLVLVESDFWLNMMNEVKKHGGKCILVNGKMSKRSYMRLNRFRSFSKSLFTSIDLFCLQNELYRARFEALGIDQKRLFSTGNLKFDIERGKLSDQGVEEFRARLGIDHVHPVLVVSCTHNKEESLVLPELEKLWEKFPDMRVLLAPRHPDRFETVASLIEQREVPFVRYSREVPMSDERLMLVDAVGVLDPCYQVADAVLMCGSFVSKIGGHNIFEPLEGGVCLFFGPHMETQEELVALVLDANAGVQVEVGSIAQSIASCLESEEKQQELLKNSRELVQSVRGSTARCFEKIEKVIV